ncbi:MAG: hypothetical protein HUN05_19370 [Desulfobacter sp.]|nr:MAG: hypothetical protein HUN05_19370 [Desulfobacter sp.]
MQAALAGMQGVQLPQTPVQQAQASGQAVRPASGGQPSDINESPKDISLPKVADSQAGYSIHQPTADDHGAQAQPQVGAPMTDADITAKLAAMEARDTGGGLTPENERPEQGNNPYEGMTKEQMQAAFARDVGMQSQQGTTYDRDKWQLSAKGWPLQCGRYEDTLKNRLKTDKGRAQSMGRSDIIARIKVVNENLEKLGKLRKKRYPVEVVQKALDACVQEVHAIDVSTAQAQ